ncbi:hypothetical protein [Chryseobacterium indologenes]|uniref:hypothetical protein n=1 Tax=Chryseobacterium indologenes TaxID=253 RepID=UPI0009A13EC7|nr:hypothetical protein [Chryseobacterium indologenes]
MEAKYIKEFNLTGNNMVDVDKICKDWNDKFIISTWNNDGVISYALQIFGKKVGVRILKSQISEEQAKQIITNLDLVYVHAGIPQSAGSYKTRAFIEEEIERLESIQSEKENELIIINRLIYNHRTSIGV